MPNYSIELDAALAGAEDVTRAYIAANPSVGAGSAMDLFMLLHAKLSGSGGAVSGATEAAAVAGSLEAAGEARSRAKAEAVRATEAYKQARAAYKQVREAHAAEAAALREAEAAAEAAAQEAAAPAVVARVPFVPVGESIAPDGQYLVCLVDGKKVKMLKRYIKRWNFTPESYRQAFGLGEDYKMTAPAYSALKSQEAVTLGLGTKENKAGGNLARVAELQTA